MSYLKKLNVQQFKIDKSFILDNKKIESVISIIAAIIQLAHSLGLLVVAEGVETKEQYQILKDLSCNRIQGLYILRPFPEKKIRRLS